MNKMIAPYLTEKALADAMIAYERSQVALGRRDALPYDRLRRNQFRPLVPQAIEVLSYMRTLDQATPQEIAEGVQLRLFIVENHLSILEERGFIVKTLHARHKVNIYRIRRNHE